MDLLAATRQGLGRAAHSIALLHRLLSARFGRATLRVEPVPRVAGGSNRVAIIWPETAHPCLWALLSISLCITAASAGSIRSAAPDCPLRCRVVRRAPLCHPAHGAPGHGSNPRATERRHARPMAPARRCTGAPSGAEPERAFGEAGRLGDVAAKTRPRPLAGPSTRGSAASRSACVPNPMAP